MSCRCPSAADKPMVRVPDRHSAHAVLPRCKMLSRHRPLGSTSWQGVALSRAQHALISSAGTARVVLWTTSSVSLIWKLPPGAAVVDGAAAAAGGKVGCCGAAELAGPVEILGCSGGRPAASRSTALRRLHALLLSAMNGLGALLSRVSLPVLAADCTAARHRSKGKCACPKSRCSGLAGLTMKQCAMLNSQE